MFTGVFGNCDAARPYLDTSVNLFDESIWIETVKSATVNIKNNMHNPDHPCEWYEREFLAILAYESYSKDYVSVLDFGGGPATNYASVVGKIPLNNQIYHIVDTPSNLNLAGNCSLVIRVCILLLQILMMILIFNYRSQLTILLCPAVPCNTHVIGNNLSSD